MQIIPSTGADQANKLGWPPLYEDTMLYQPNVSLRLGAHYLATNRDLLGGDLYAALAAYNAGPGNADAWRGLSGSDPDLFLETIRFAETRDYIRGIYENYRMYVQLYETIP
jgi:soluble lytic murein transglycosylase